MYKLLIAEGSDELRMALTETLGSAYIVKSCADGKQARILLSDFKPDILILDLMLPLVDGITLLQEAKEKGLHPITLVTLCYVSEYILGALQKYEADYLMSKPCSVDAVASQIQALASTIEAPAHPDDDPSKCLSSVLLELSLTPKVDGFGYLLGAIPLYMADPLQGLTKELYSAVGHSFGKSGQQVERCIRTAIQSAWRRGDMHIWQRYFPAAPDGRVPRPSNGDFIAHLATFLSQQKAYRSA